MVELSVNQFRANIKSVVDKAISDHEVVRVHRRKDQDFMVVSVEDWEREQETLHVLQNGSLMKQISESLKTHIPRTGYRPTDEELNEINSF